MGYRTHAQVYVSIVHLCKVSVTNAPDKFRAIAEQFAHLSSELRNCTDPETRLNLLKQFRVLLAEADVILATQPSSK